MISLVLDIYFVIITAFGCLLVIDGVPLVEEIQSPDLETLECRDNGEMVGQGINLVSQSTDDKKADSAVDDRQELQVLALQKDAARLKRENDLEMSEIGRLGEELEICKNQFEKLTEVLTPEKSRVCTLEDCSKVKAEIDVTAELRRKEEEVGALRNTIT